MVMAKEAMNIVNEYSYVGRNEDISELLTWMGIISYSQTLNSQEEEPKFIDYFKSAYEADSTNCIAIFKYALSLEEQIIPRNIELTDNQQLKSFTTSQKDSTIALLKRIKYLYTKLANQLIVMEMDRRELGPSDIGIRTIDRVSDIVRRIERIDLIVYYYKKSDVHE